MTHNTQPRPSIKMFSDTDNVKCASNASCITLDSHGRLYASKFCKHRRERTVVQIIESVREISYCTHNLLSPTNLQPILPPHVLAVRVAAHLDDAGVEERLDIRRQLADGLQLTRNRCQPADDLQLVDGLCQRGEVLEVTAHCGNVVLHSVGRCRDIGIVGHTYTSSNCNSISRRCGSDSGRTTRYAVM